MKKESKSFKFLKLGILFFGISILLWRCNEEENLIQKEQAQQETLIKKVENVTFNSISGAVTNTIRNNHKSKSEKNIIYNYNSIVKTIDILCNTKYSILFQIKNQPKNVLYNLITGIEKDESPITPYVMKYTISNLKTNKTYNFGDFNGIIEKYAYDDFFKNINNQKYHHKDDNETPLKPCLKSGVFGGGGGNNGNANGSFSDNLNTTNIGTSNISGFRSPFYSFSSGTGISGLTPTSCISGLTTGPLSDPEVDGDDDDGGSGGGSSNDVVPPGCIDESVTTNHITKLIEDCYDTNSPINPKCIGKLLDENGNCIEEDIIDNTNTPCVSNIIKILQEKDMRGALVPDLVGKSHLSQMVLDLFSNCTNYDLIIDIKELGHNLAGHPINAQTNGFESITLDDDLVRQATQLSIAKTLIHESLHIYINLKTNRNNIDKDFYDAIKAYYDKFKTPNLSQHNFMAQFVEALAYSLSSYDNHKQDISYYKAMSWGGLESSDIYKSLNNKDQIQKIIKNERYAKKDSKSNKCEE